MSAIKAVWLHGQVILDGQVDWPEGSKLIVSEAAPVDIEFMTEEQQGDDPESIRQWIEELKAIPPLSMSQSQESELDAWRQKVKEFNLEAVRRQMQEGIS